MADNNRNPSHRRVLPSAESIRMVGGLAAVFIGVVAVTGLAIVTIAFIDNHKEAATTIVPLSTAAFGVIATVVGAYLGMKIGTDQSKGLADDAIQAHARLAAVQAFIPPDKQQAAMDAAESAATQHRRS